jgi:hypothetical protein
MTSLIEVFGIELEKCQKLITEKVNLYIGLNWKNLINDFCEFVSYVNSASYHLPVIMQTLQTNDKQLLIDLVDFIVGKSPIDFYSNHRITLSINSPQKLARVERESSIKNIPKKVGSHSPHTLGDDDPITTEWIEYYQNAINMFIPEKEWWVTCYDDLQPIEDNISELRNLLGLFHYCDQPPKLCLLIFGPQTTLRKSFFIDAKRSPGWWPWDDEWGKTVNVIGFTPGAREGLQEFLTPIGLNQLVIYNLPPKVEFVDWKSYCESRIPIIIRESQ